MDSLLASGVQGSAVDSAMPPEHHCSWCCVAAAPLVNAARRTWSPGELRFFVSLTRQNAAESVDAAERMRMLRSITTHRKDFGVPNRIEIARGTKYGSWTFIDDAPPPPECLTLSSRSARYVRARCVCGNERVLAVKSIRSGDSRSCGCLSSNKRRAEHSGFCRALRFDRHD